MLLPSLLFNIYHISKFAENVCILFIKIHFDVVCEWMSCSSLLLSFRWCVLFSYSRAINRIITHRGEERKRKTIDMHARYQCSKAMIILHKQNQQTHAYIWCAHTQFKRRIKYEHDPPTRSWLVVLHKDSFAYTRTHTPNTAERMHMHTSTRTHTLANTYPLLTAFLSIITSHVYSSESAHKHTYEHHTQTRKM